MSAVVPKNGPTRQLDRAAEPDEIVTDDEAKDPPRLARRIMIALRDIATLKRRWWPREIYFEDRAVDATASTKYRFPHGFGGRVRYACVDWVATGAGTSYCLEKHADTDENTLVLISGSAGTITLRVWEAG